MDIIKESKKFYGLDSQNLNDVSDEYFNQFFDGLLKINESDMIDIILGILDWHTKEQISEKHLNMMFSDEKIKNILTRLVS